MLLQYLAHLLALLLVPLATVLVGGLPLSQLPLKAILHN
jgi:hypothetical protein